MRLTSSPLRRAGLGVGAAAAMVFALSGCATETAALDYTPPTMAPVQSIDEACEVAGEEVNRLTREAETQLKQGIDRALADLAARQMPSFDILSGSIDDAIAEVQEEVDNPEVSSALQDVRSSLQAFGEQSAPDSLLAVPGYITSLTSQTQDLVTAATNLNALCGIDMKLSAAENPNAQDSSGATDQDSNMS